MSRTLHRWMLLGGVLGAVTGGLAHAYARGAPWLELAIRWVAQPIGQVFLRLLFMLVVPLLFSALVMGVAEMGDIKKLGRVGLLTLVFTAAVSAIAVGIGIALVHLVEPGSGLPDALRADLLGGAKQRALTLAPAAQPKGGIDLLVGIVPSNPIKAAVDGDFLALMFFSLVFGVGLVLTQGASARRLGEAIEGLFQVSMRLIELVIRLAPIGVAALLFKLTAELGAGVLLQLGKFVLVVVAGLAIHQVVTYSLAVRLLGGYDLRRFWSGIQPAMITAFSTASSNATLPVALEVAEERLALPRQISRFVLTIGATANQNGTALFEGVTVLFLAQLYGVELGVGAQITVMAICILGGIGTAGVPAGSIPVVAMILGLVGVPPEGIGIVLGVDRFLDMCRTTVNVSGDLAAAVVVSRYSGEASEAAR